MLGSFQGFVGGPQEFAEGIAGGVRSLLGHTVGKQSLSLKNFILALLQFFNMRAYTLQTVS